MLCIYTKLITCNGLQIMGIDNSQSCMTVDEYLTSHHTSQVIAKGAAFAP